MIRSPLNTENTFPILLELFSIRGSSVSPPHSLGHVSSEKGTASAHGPDQGELILGISALNRLFCYGNSTFRVGWIICRNL